uniref:Uncharacterized protein n=1 Tax=Romanomermis culicivorax TaxID=13658 RepID=A0A915JQG6_ROMCU
MYKTHQLEQTLKRIEWAINNEKAFVRLNTAVALILDNSFAVAYLNNHGGTLMFDILIMIRNKIVPNGTPTSNNNSHSSFRFCCSIKEEKSKSVTLSLCIIEMIVLSNFLILISILLIRHYTTSDRIVIDSEQKVICFILWTMTGFLWLLVDFLVLLAVKIMNTFLVLINVIVRLLTMLLDLIIVVLIWTTNQPKPARYNPDMQNPSANKCQSNAQTSSSSADEVGHLKQEVARLTAHLAKLTAQQRAPVPLWQTPPPQPSTPNQSIGQRSSGAHLQTYSFHGLCTHSDTDCRAQHPPGAAPNNNAANGGHCYFCPMGAHPMD